MRRRIELVLAVALVSAPFDARAEGESEAERLATLLALESGMRVAEIGAGEGDLAFEMAERVGPGGRIFATELEGDELNALRGRVKFAAVTNLTVVTAQLAATGLALVPGGTFVAIDFLPTWYLVPFSPDGVGEERTGHGITPDAALREFEAAGFARARVIESWSDRWFAGEAYALALRAPERATTP